LELGCELSLLPSSRQIEAEEGVRFHFVRFFKQSNTLRGNTLKTLYVKMDQTYTVRT